MLTPAAIDVLVVWLLKLTVKNLRIDVQWKFTLILTRYALSAQ